MGDDTDLDLLLLLISVLIYGGVCLYDGAAAAALAGVAGAPPAWPLWAASAVAGVLCGYCWGRFRSG